MLVIIHNRNKYLSPLSPFPALPGLFVGCVPQPTQKRLPIKTSPHQCDAPGIDPMSSPHLRINCTDPVEDSCPRRITVRVLASSRTRLFQALLSLLGHSDRGVSPNQRNGDVCPHTGPELSAHPPRSGGQPAHLPPLPGPGSNLLVRGPGFLFSPS